MAAKMTDISASDFVTVAIIPWPYSQVCMQDCPYGEFMDSDTFNSSNFICLRKANMTDNDGISCTLISKEYL